MDAHAREFRTVGASLDDTRLAAASNAGAVKSFTLLKVLSLSKGRPPSRLQLRAAQLPSFYR